MSFYKKSIIVIMLFSLFIGSLFILSSTPINASSYNRNLRIESIDFESPATSTISNHELIEDVINAKLLQFSENGYFSQLYEPNLQSIYFALSALNSIDRSYTINNTAMTNVIMSYYSEENHLFIDRYAERYLDTDFSLEYYPLNSLLEANCYAILALDILDRADLINNSEMVSFIWSCYQPVTSGFIGQPYSETLESRFKIATMDNTYYAVKTLDIMLSNWDAYQTKVTDIIMFINSLQKTGSHCGFKNDLDDSFYSLELFPQTEPTIFSSYYSIKTLEVFGPGALTSIRVSDFIGYLSELYNENEYYFDSTPNSYYRLLNVTNIVATALGLELSMIYGFSNISYSEVLDFIFTHRTSAGGWGRSTNDSYYELIDTFQILQSLKALNELSQLTPNKRSEIVEHIKLYSREYGYFPLSQEYMSTSLVDDMLSILSYHNRILEFDLEALYTSLKRSIYYSSAENCERFYSITRLEYIEIAEGNFRLRSRPIEYYSLGTHVHISGLNFRVTWRSAFEFLSIFQKIYKLDDYAIECDFNNLINKIISSQFLDSSSQYSAFYGGFLPYLHCLNYEPERKIKYMNFEYSYYAVRTLELLNDYLELGALKDIGFDTSAFLTHVIRHIVETTSELYFNPFYSDAVDSILENTFYMVYCLLALDEFSLSTLKIKNYILNNLDYTNMKAIYYAYKLSEALNLDIEFDLNQTQSLVQTLYSEEYNEYYRTTEKKLIDQRVFYYIYYIAKFSKISMKSTLPVNVALGDTFDICVEFGNLIVKDYGVYTTVRLESNQLGTVVLDRLDNNTYGKKEIFVSMDNRNYPAITGNITIYEGITLKGSFSIHIETTYDILTKISKKEFSDRIRITVEGSFLFGSGVEPLYDSEMYSVIYQNGEEIGIALFSNKDTTTYREFILEYFPSQRGNYMFELYLDEKYQEEHRHLGHVSFNYFSPHPSGNNSPLIYQNEINSSIALVIGLIGAPLGIITLISRDKLKKVIKTNFKPNKLK